MAAYGLRLVGHLTGGVHNARIRRYALASGDATATFIGDAVKSAGSADATTGLPTIAQAAAGDTLRGVVVGFDPIEGVAVGSENLNRMHRPASTAMYAMVCDDPFAIYQVQALSTGATTTHILAVADVGENCDIEVAAGSTTTGLSGMNLDASTHTTSSKQLRVLAQAQRVGNIALGTDLSDVLVMINQHELKSTTGV